MRARRLPPSLHPLRYRDPLLRDVGAQQRVMIAKVMQRRGMGHAGDPCALAKRHPIRAFSSHQLVDGVEQSLPQLAVMVFLCQIKMLANYLDDVKIIRSNLSLRCLDRRPR